MHSENKKKDADWTSAHRFTLLVEVMAKSEAEPQGMRQDLALADALQDQFPQQVPRQVALAELVH